ncbi:MAG: 1,4-dihydroxy-2-naphthoate octaprenyltransferase [Phycisphaerales bacterium]|nr:1,4-dihydroxy-2-naphthoate octaprenyltransferase [Phycisphaerales bacterium]
MAHTLKVWIDATRPTTLSASVAPVAMGTAIAYGAGGFHPGACAAAAVGALGIQVACNFANDYFDARKGADTFERIGPVRAVASGLVAPTTMLLATIGVLAVVVVPCAVFLVVRAGWPFAVLAAVSAALAFLYTGSRWSLAYLGLGDLVALLFFGPVAVAGTFAAQTTHWSWTPALAGLGPGFLACALLSVNNLRDEPTDRAANKRTLAVRFGTSFARAEFVACGVAAALVAVAFAIWFRHYSLLAAVFAVITLLPAMRRVIAGESGRLLNGVLASAGRALLLYGVLFSIAWIR